MRCTENSEHLLSKCLFLCFKNIYFKIILYFKLIIFFIFLDYFDTYSETSQLKRNRNPKIKELTQEGAFYFYKKRHEDSTRGKL
jgi:hypothetical protein